MASQNTHGGRARASDMIDYAVGLDHIRQLGSAVEKGDVICRIHASSEDAADEAQHRLHSAIRLDGPVDPTNAILGAVGPEKE